MEQEKIIMRITPLLKFMIPRLSLKKTSLSDEANNINTVVLGSSHGERFIPDYFPNSFNLCSRSQDLKYSFLFYKYVTKNYPHIKKIILFYSVFSPGSEIEKSPQEKEICPAMNELFSLGVEYDDELLKRLSVEIRGKLDFLRVQSEFKKGYIPTTETDLGPDDVIKKVNSHLKLNKNNISNIYLIKLLLLVKKLGHQIVIVIPPGRSDYKKGFEMSSNCLFSSLYEIIYDFNIDHEINLINFWDDNSFVDSYFDDCHHLHCLREGSKLLTEKIFHFCN